MNSSTNVGAMPQQDYLHSQAMNRNAYMTTHVHHTLSMRIVDDLLWPTQW